MALVSALAAGVTSVLAKAGLEDVPSNLANAIRTAVVTMLLAFVFLGERLTWTNIIGVGRRWYSRARPSRRF